MVKSEKRVSSTLYVCVRHTQGKHFYVNFELKLSLSLVVLSLESSLSENSSPRQSSSVLLSKFEMLHFLKMQYTGSSGMPCQHIMVAEPTPSLDGATCTLQDCEDDGSYAAIMKPNLQVQFMEEIFGLNPHIVRGENLGR